jgi:signal transduction histidine kinase
VVFASSDGTRSVAEQAAVLVRVQELISAVDTTKAAISGVLIFGLAHDEGHLEESTVSTAVSEAAAALEELRLRSEPTLRAAYPVQNSTSLGRAIERYLQTGHAVLAGVQDGRPAAAQQQELSEFNSRYEAVMSELVAERGRRESHITAVRSGVAGVADAARFVMAFFIPVILTVGSLSYLSRRQRRQRVIDAAVRQEQLRAAKDEFLNAIAQELRTPLTAVVGFAEVLREQGNAMGRQQYQQLAAIVAEEATSTAEIIEDLLVFARANVGDLTIRPEAVDVAVMVETLATNWEARHPHRLHWSGRAVAWADPIRLRQVLQNLLKNAYRHGGEKIDVRIESGGNTVRIEVADDGPGIPADLQSRIFEPYQHGPVENSNPASIGLGLTVARSLVHLMGGGLSYRYRWRESTFVIELPNATRLTPAELVPAITGATPQSDLP